jgi:hypothetical protein
MHPQTPNNIPEALQHSTNIPHSSEHHFKAPKIFTKLQRPLQNFRDLHKTSETFTNLRGSLDTFRCLSPPSECLMDLALQWGPEKMDKEIDSGWGGLTPIPLLH